MRLDGLRPEERAFLQHKAQRADGVEAALRELVRLEMAVTRAARLALAHGKRSPAARAARRRFRGLRALLWARQDEAALAEKRFDRRRPPAGRSLGARLVSFLLPGPAAFAGGVRRPSTLTRMAHWRAE